MKAIFILFMVCTAALAAQQQFICKAVEGVSAEHDEDITVNGTSRAPSRTISGQLGRDENTRHSLTTISGVYISNETKNLQGLESLKSQLDEMQRKHKALQMQYSAKLCEEVRNLPYDGKCYSILRLSTIRRLTPTSAERECNDVGSFLAEFHTNSHQRVIQYYAMAKKENKDRIYLWAGMIYQRSNGTLGFRSGKEISIDQLKWYPNYPRETSENVALTVGTFGEAENGFVNKAESYYQYGVICEKDL